jgi:hypothetical protein
MLFQLGQGRNWPKGVYVGCEGQKTGVMVCDRP